MTSRAHLVRGSDSQLIALRPSGVAHLTAEGLGTMYDRVWPLLKHNPAAVRELDPATAVGRFVRALEELQVLQAPGEASMPGLSGACVTPSRLRALRACAMSQYRVVVLATDRCSPAHQRTLGQWAELVASYGGAPRLLRMEPRGVRAYPVPTSLDRLPAWLELTALLNVQVPNRLPASAEPWSEPSEMVHTHRDARAARVLALLDALLLSPAAYARGWRCGLSDEEAAARAVTRGARALATGSVEHDTVTAFGLSIPVALCCPVRSSRQRRSDLTVATPGGRP